MLYENKKVCAEITCTETSDVEGHATNSVWETVIDLVDIYFENRTKTSRMWFWSCWQLRDGGDEDTQTKQMLQLN